MKLVKILPVTLFISMSAIGIAGAQPAAGSVTSPAEPESTCRRVISEQDQGGTVYCGTEEQWAEFDRRVELINAGVTCRYAYTAYERCMTAKQWKVFDRRQRGISDALGMGREASSGTYTGMTMLGTPADIEASNNAMQMQGR